MDIQIQLDKVKELSDVLESKDSSLADKIMIVKTFLENGYITFRDRNPEK